MSLLRRYHNLQKNSLLPLTAAVGTATVASLWLINKRKKNKEKSAKVDPESSVRKIGHTSHIHIPTENVERTKYFFEAFGLIDCSTSCDNTTSTTTKSNNDVFTILTCPNPKNKMHQPYIVLEKTNATSTGNNNGEKEFPCASEVGTVGRLCIGVKDVYKTVERLRQDLNMYPVAPPVCDRPGTPDGKTGINKENEVVIVAYRDVASGVMLELVSLNMTSIMNRMTVSIVQTITSLQFPIFVHANINVSNYSDGMKAYNLLGYTEIAKHFGYVKNNLYKALEIPDPGIAKEVTLIKTKKETLFAIDLIEWEEKSKSSGGIATDNPIRIAFTVNDLPNEIDRITPTNSVTASTPTTTAGRIPYWTLVDNPKIVEYPAPLDKAIVATVRDKDGMEVDLVEYPVTLTTQLRVPTTNKVILLTGCDSGFGRSLSCRLSLLGFDVVAACYTEEGAEFLDRIVTKTVVADLGTSDGVEAVLDACRDELNHNYKKLWAIVNNAGVCFPGNVDWQSPDIYRISMDVNFHAPVKIIHELLQELKAVPGSRIMQTSSVCGLLAQPTNSAYCSTKHALEAYSDSLRCELYPYDCHVTIVQPATMKTKLGLTYWDTWYKGFQQAPKERQTSFDSDKIETFVDESRKRLYEAAEDSDVTTLAMVKALLEPNPPTRLRTGIAAELFFRPISMLSDTMRDGILWSLMQFDSVHATISEEKK